MSAMVIPLRDDATLCPRWCAVDHAIEGHRHPHIGLPIRLDDVAGRFSYLVCFYRKGVGRTVVSLIAASCWSHPGSGYDRRLRHGIKLESVESASEVLAILDEASRSRLADMIDRASRPDPWWKQAGNPPCPEWCTTEHADDELAEAGYVVHFGVVGTGRFVTVERVECVVAVDDDPGKFVVDEPEHVEVYPVKGSGVSFSSRTESLELETAAAVAEEILALTASVRS